VFLIVAFIWRVHLDTVSLQIFGDIQETQFLGGKMELHDHLKNAFPGGIVNRRIMFNCWFASVCGKRAVFENKNNWQSYFASLINVDNKVRHSGTYGYKQQQGIARERER